ncbi:methionine aminotransferase [Pseudopedobacter sp.]|uniref:methionine aminotransferase n=1 Tax=Pseudopedobacter sp. TaxID=1936787 RepID=UPI003341DEDB
MINIISKLPNTKTTIFSKMSGLAKEYNAINLSQGFPDFDCDPELVKLISYKMEKGHNQYAPMPGVLELRKIISNKIASAHQSVYDPETEITVTAGGTQAIFTAIASVIRQNDEVIIFEPAYDSYAPTVKAFGGLVKAYEMAPPHFEINWDLVKKLVSVNTKMIIINSPHNPTGRILNDNDIKELINITKNTDILILSDEVYEHIIYDGNEHKSLCKYPELKERTFITASFGKLFHATGWKVGYCCAPEPLMKEFRKIHQFQVFSVNTPMQYAFAEYLSKHDIFSELPKFFQEKRDYFRKLMSETRFTLLPCEGSYFQNVTYEKITNLKDIDFAVKLVKENQVASIPNSAFYTKTTDYRNLRFCFAKKQETLEKAVDKLLKL